MLMVMGRAKSHAGKVNARLPRSLNTAFRAWIEGVADSHRYFGRRLGVEPCVGALVEQFMSLAPRDREAFLQTWLPRLEARDANDLSVSPVTASDDDARGVSPVVFAEGGELSAAKGNRKRAKPKN